MAIKKWDPFRDLIEISQDMDRLFEEGIGHRFRHAHPFRNVWVPAVDMCETDDEVIVRAEIPGINKEDLIVEVESDHLILRGERRFERNVKSEHYHRVERAHGEFYRALPLPAPIRQDKIQANYRDGVLSVSLPKTEPSRARTIEIKSK